MTKLLIRLFIEKRRFKTPSAKIGAYGVLSGIVGIICNVLLFAVKFFLGLTSGAISIVVDGLNNLSDSASSISTLVGYKLAGKPADEKHPYGHGRIEYITSLVISIFILFMGYELIRTSFDRIFHPQSLQITWIVLLILILSIGVKFWLFLFNRKLYKITHSPALKATAFDSINDCLITLMIVISLVIQNMTGLSLDGYMGLIVAAFIIYTGIRSIKEGLSPLIGEAPNKELVETIRQIVLGHEEIQGMHHLLVHDYGLGHSDISLHVELPKNMDQGTAHGIIDHIEKEIMENCNCHVTIHIDPM